MTQSTEKRSIQELVILLGGNLSDRKKTIDTARQLLAEDLGPVAGRSSLYASEAWGKKDQPDFFNQVVVFESTKKPSEILKITTSVEKQLGRVRHEKWAERLIDIDILFYGNEVVEEKELKIPHPHIHERRFTLEPLVEIMPQYLHPVKGVTMRELLADCEDTGWVEKLEDHA
jgi:2-amino-4-hydroxy-6-hydroxymethyldihydropteridine diphosphokinase